MNENITLGSNIEQVLKCDNCIIYQMENATGEGIMTCYEVFKGVYLIYNDFHIDRCKSNLQISDDMFCIDHCREGRMEWEFTKDKYVYIEAEDIKIDDRGDHQKYFTFPLKHYHGISIAIFINEATKSLNQCINGISIDLKEIIEKFKSCGSYFITRGDLKISHIFSELYDVPKEIKQEYYKIKIIELLLYLKAMNVPFNYAERPYFYKSQIGKVKEVEDFIVKNLDKQYSQEELAKKFNIPLTALKNCFKAVHGATIYSYTQNYRMNIAAIRLLHSNETVAQIAVSLGYNNAGKFSTAFKRVLGKLPQEYRLQNTINS